MNDCKQPEIDFEHDDFDFDTIEEELRVLKKRFERKELTEEVYLREKAKLLDGMK